MQTTVQISGRTLQLLKKIKEEKKESLAGFLGKRPRAWILKDLREKHDLF